jgi:hypothetical protein
MTGLTQIGYDDIGGKHMNGIKGTKLLNGRNSRQVGLLANGSSRLWDVAIDETISGRDRWFMQVEGPSIYVYFQIHHPDIVGKAVDYFRKGKQYVHSQSGTSNGELLIGGNKHTPIFLVRDDEFADRIFLVVGPRSSPVVRYTISGTAINKIVEALRQVKEDLDN